MIAAMAAMAAMAALAPAAPVITPDASTLMLDEIGLYRVGYRRRNASPQDMPMGWSGHFDDSTGISCLPYPDHAGRKAFLLHSPWRGGTGITFQEFRFAVPRSVKIVLTGETAMRGDIVGRSDGAEFRVVANGRTVLDRQQATSVWQPFRLNLASGPDGVLLLRFEVGPGPADDPGFDYSLWADRKLTLAGYGPPRMRSTPRAKLDLRRMTTQRINDPAPSCGFPHSSTVRVSGQTATLRYEGADGALEYRWQTEAGPLGSLNVTVRSRGGVAHMLALGTGGGIRWTTPVRVSGTRLAAMQGNAAVECRQELSGSFGKALLTVGARLLGKTLALSVSCDRPIIESLAAGSWGPTLRRREIAVPYLGTVTYHPREGLFTNRFLDWTRSAASAHVGDVARYEPLTDGSRVKPRERILYTAAWHLAEVLPNIPNPASPFLREVGGKIVLDVWGGRYEDIARKLETLHGYGIRNCIVLVHDWQRSGYDNALPMHLPAAADKGGDQGMGVLVATAARLGYRIALHENYVDYYPNYDLFDEKHIALDPAGRRVNAWYNPGTRIQSFAVQPNAILPLARTQSALIHERYGTNACYLDVHSAVPPWFHVDFRAGEPGAGMFATVYDAHRALWAYERRTHEGPVFGEGNAHWYWSGLLDGVEAQFGTGWPANQGQSAPLMVDFDLLKMHPLQVNHGQGYYERWWSELPWGSIPPASVMDQYRLQEALYGHAGFLGAAVWDKLPYAWIEHHLLTPLTQRHAGVPVASLDYLVGGEWVDPTRAAIAQDWNRPRVVYANGLTVIGNNGPDTWRAHGATLPKHGWLAHGAGVTAYTALRDTVVVDYAETDRSVFANARPARDWALSSVTEVRPHVAQFRQIGNREFTVTYRWDVASPPKSDYTCFVHFSTKAREQFDEGIKFQQDHGLPRPTSQWQAGSSVTDGPYHVSIPDDVADGAYEWSVGLFRQDAGRATIEGPVDRSGRVLLGTLEVSDGGRTLTFRGNTDAAPSRADAYRDRLNVDSRLVAFGTVKTNGSVAVEIVNGQWLLRPFPRDRTFTVLLRASKFGRPQEVRCVGGTEDAVQPLPRGPWWELPLNGASEYRWPAH